MFVRFQVYKTFMNKLDVVCVICTVRKCNVLLCMWNLVPLGVAFQNYPETFLPTTFSAWKNSDCGNLVPSSKEQVGLILLLRHQKSTSHHPSKLRHRVCQRCAVTVLQGRWTILIARSIHVTFSGIFHLGKMPGEASQPLLPQWVQQVVETAQMNAHVPCPVWMEEDLSSSQF